MFFIKMDYKPDSLSFNDFKEFSNIKEVICEKLRNKYKGNESEKFLKLDSYLKRAYHKYVNSKSKSSGFFRDLKFHPKPWLTMTDNMLRKKFRIKNEYVNLFDNNVVQDAKECMILALKNKHRTDEFIKDTLVCYLQMYIDNTIRESGSFENGLKEMQRYTMEKLKKNSKSIPKSSNVVTSVRKKPCPLSKKLKLATINPSEIEKVTIKTKSKLLGPLSKRKPQCEHSKQTGSKNLLALKKPSQQKEIKTISTEKIKKKCKSYGPLSKRKNEDNSNKSNNNQTSEIGKQLSCSVAPFEQFTEKVDKCKKNKSKLLGPLSKRKSVDVGGRVDEQSLTRRDYVAYVKHQGSKNEPCLKTNIGKFDLPERPTQQCTSNSKSESSAKSKFVIGKTNDNQKTIKSYFAGKSAVENINKKDVNRRNIALPADKVEKVKLEMVIRNKQLHRVVEDNVLKDGPANPRIMADSKEMSATPAVIPDKTAKNLIERAPNTRNINITSNKTSVKEIDSKNSQKSEYLSLKSSAGAQKTIPSNTEQSQSKNGKFPKSINTRQSGTKRVGKRTKPTTYPLPKRVKLTVADLKEFAGFEEESSDNTCNTNLENPLQNICLMTSIPVANILDALPSESQLTAKSLKIESSLKTSNTETTNKNDIMQSSGNSGEENLDPLIIKVEKFEYSQYEDEVEYVHVEPPKAIEIFDDSDFLQNLFDGKATQSQNLTESLNLDKKLESLQSQSTQNMNAQLNGQSQCMLTTENIVSTTENFLGSQHPFTQNSQQDSLENSSDGVESERLSLISTNVNVSNESDSCETENNFLNRTEEVTEMCSPHKNRFELITQGENTEEILPDRHSRQSPSQTECVSLASTVIFLPRKNSSEEDNHEKENVEYQRRNVSISSNVSSAKKKADNQSEEIFTDGDVVTPDTIYSISSPSTDQQNIDMNNRKQLIEVGLTKTSHKNNSIETIENHTKNIVNQCTLLKSTNTNSDGVVSTEITPNQIEKSILQGKNANKDLAKSSDREYFSDPTEVVVARNTNEENMLPPKISSAPSRRKTNNVQSTTNSLNFTSERDITVRIKNMFREKRRAWKERHRKVPFLSQPLPSEIHRNLSLRRLSYNADSNRQPKAANCYREFNLDFLLSQSNFEDVILEKIRQLCPKVKQRTHIMLLKNEVVKMFQENIENNLKLITALLQGVKLNNNILMKFRQILVDLEKTNLSTYFYNGESTIHSDVFLSFPDIENNSVIERTTRENSSHIYTINSQPILKSGFAAGSENSFMRAINDISSLNFDNENNLSELLQQLSESLANASALDESYDCNNHERSPDNYENENEVSANFQNDLLNEERTDASQPATLPSILSLDREMANIHSESSFDISEFLISSKPPLRESTPSKRNEIESKKNKSNRKTIAIVDEPIKVPKAFKERNQRILPPGIQVPQKDKKLFCRKRIPSSQRQSHRIVETLENNVGVQQNTDAYLTDDDISIIMQELLPEEVDNNNDLRVNKITNVSTEDMASTVIFDVDQTVINHNKEQCDILPETLVFDPAFLNEKYDLESNTTSDSNHNSVNHLTKIKEKSIIESNSNEIIPINAIDNPVSLQFSSKNLHYSDKSMKNLQNNEDNIYALTTFTERIEICQPETEISVDIITPESEAENIQNVELASTQSKNINKLEANDKLPSSDSVSKEILEKSPERMQTMSNKSKKENQTVLPSTPEKGETFKPPKIHIISTKILVPPKINPQIGKATGSGQLNDSIVPQIRHNFQPLELNLRQKNPSTKTQKKKKTQSQQKTSANVQFTEFHISPVDDDSLTNQNTENEYYIEDVTLEHNNEGKELGFSTLLNEDGTYFGSSELPSTLFVNLPPSSQAKEEESNITAERMIIDKVFNSQLSDMYTPESPKAREDINNECNIEQIEQSSNLTSEKISNNPNQFVSALAEEEKSQKVIETLCNEEDKTIMTDQILDYGTLETDHSSQLSSTKSTKFSLHNSDEQINDNTPLHPIAAPSVESHIPAINSEQTENRDLQESHICNKLNHSGNGANIAITPNRLEEINPQIIYNKNQTSLTETDKSSAYKNYEKLSKSIDSKPFDPEYLAISQDESAKQEYSNNGTEKISLGNDPKNHEQKETTDVSNRSLESQINDQLNEKAVTLKRKAKSQNKSVFETTRSLLRGAEDKAFVKNYQWHSSRACLKRSSNLLRKVRRERFSKIIRTRSLENVNFMHITFLSLVEIKLNKEINEFDYRSSTPFLQNFVERSITAIINFRRNSCTFININGKTLSILLGFSIKECDSIFNILRYIERMHYKLTDSDPIEKSLEYRVLFYLFKTLPKFREVTFEYNRIGENYITNITERKKPTKPFTNLTEAFDPDILEAIAKAKRSIR